MKQKYMLLSASGNNYTKIVLKRPHVDMHVMLQSYTSYKNVLYKSAGGYAVNIIQLHN